MKVKINWSELGKQLWAALKPVLLGAVGGGDTNALTNAVEQSVPATTYLGK